MQCDDIPVQAGQLFNDVETDEPGRACDECEHADIGGRDTLMYFDRPLRQRYSRAVGWILGSWVTYEKILQNPIALGWGQLLLTRFTVAAIELS